MNATEQKSRTVDPKWKVNKWEVSVNSSKVYCNGRQQVMLTLYVEVMDSTGQVKLTAAEKASIHLVDYYDRTKMIPFSVGDGRGDNYLGWTADLEYQGYESFPTKLSADPARSQADSRGVNLSFSANVQPTGGVSLNFASIPDYNRTLPAYAPEKARAGGDRISLYVSANRDAMGHEPLKVAFGIKGDNGTVYYTNGVVYIEADGTESYSLALDLSETMEITPVTPVTYDPTYFQLNTLYEIPVRETPQAAIFNRAVSVTLFPVPGGSRLPLHKMIAEPAGMIHWDDELPQNSVPCFTGYASPGETALHWNSQDQVPMGNLPLPSLTWPEKDVGVIMLCGRNDIMKQQYPGSYRGPVNLTLIDAYGTDHVLRLTFVKDERDELTLNN